VKKKVREIELIGSGLRKLLSSGRNISRKLFHKCCTKYLSEKEKQEERGFNPTIIRYWDAKGGEILFLPVPNHKKLNQEGKDRGGSVLINSELALASLYC